MKSNNFVIFMVVLGICLAVVAGYVSLKSQKKYIQEPYAKETSCSYAFLNPLRCEPDLATKKKEYIVLRNTLTDYIDEQKSKKVLTSAAVYFRDLQNGPTVSINSQEDFVPASLLKLPLLLTYYKKAETNPKLLERRILVTEELTSMAQKVIPEKSAKIGETYTVESLLELLITESDNTSWKALLTDLRKNYSEEDFIETLSDLGIVDPRKRQDQLYLTVQSYAAIFRILYNSSYLDLDMSNKALELLSNTTFSQGIVAGIPQDITVAHKFGEQKKGDEQQFHDCGIVYYPRNPYIVCIMTRGHNPDELTPVIKHLSQTIYEEVVSRAENE